MSKNNFAFVKQTPKFLRELQESQDAVTAQKDREREERTRNFEDEAPVVVNAADFQTHEQLKEAEPSLKAEVSADDKKKAKLLQNVQKRNKNLLSFDDDEEE